METTNMEKKTATFAVKENGIVYISSGQPFTDKKYDIKKMIQVSNPEVFRGILDHGLLSQFYGHVSFLKQLHCDEYHQHTKASCFIADVNIHSNYFSQPSEQKPHKEVKFTLSAAIENLDKLSSIGKSLLPEQKPSEGAEEISYRAWRTLVNSGWANVQGEILNAMQEYADLQKKQLADLVQSRHNQLSEELEDNTIEKQASLKELEFVLNHLKK